MVNLETVNIAIVDYGLGNLFSVKHACSYVGMETIITSNRQEIMQADVVILPGVGAFGDAMQTLIRLDLVSPLKDIANSGKYLIGICLGMQLMMTESYEFGHHKGLGIIEGSVIRFKKPKGSFGKLKVPHIGWNSIYKPNRWIGNSINDNCWEDTPVAGSNDGEFMYFIHSFYAVPEKNEMILSISKYGDIEFCSSLKYKNVFAFQFHPERSGPSGLLIYHNIAKLIKKKNMRLGD